MHQIRISRPTAVAIAGLLGAGLTGPTASPVIAATETATMDVTAFIDGGCSIDVFTHMEFGQYENSQIDSTAVLTLSCSSPREVTVNLSNGLNPKFGERSMAHESSSESWLLYMLHKDSGRVNPWGQGDEVSFNVNSLPLSVNVYGRIEPSLQVETLLEAGEYAGAITATLSF